MTMPPPRLSAFLIMVVLISPTVRPSPVFPGFMHSRAGGEPEDRWATTLARSWLRQLAEAQPSQAQENAGDERGINDAWAPTAEDIAAAVSGRGSTRGDALVESLRRELWRLSQQRPKYQDMSWPQGHNGDRISPTGLAWLLRSLESRGRLGSNDEVEEPEEEEELEESYAEYNQPSTWPEDNALPEMGVDSRFEQRRLPWSENDRENLREPGESSVWPGRRPLPPYTAREPTFNRLRPGQVDTGEEIDEEALRGLLRYLGQRAGAKASPRMRSLGESFRSPLRRREAPMSYADPPNSEGFKEKIAAEKSASHNTTQPQDPDGARGPQ